MRYRLYFALFMMAPMVLMGQTIPPSNEAGLATRSVVRITPRSGRVVAGRLIYQSKDTLLIDQLGIAGLSSVAVSNIQSIDIGERSISRGLLMTAISGGAFWVLAGANKNVQTRQVATVGIATLAFLNMVSPGQYIWRSIAK